MERKSRRPPSAICGSRAAPYLAVALALDMAELRDLARHRPAPEAAPASPLASAEAAPDMIDAMTRLIGLEGRADLPLLAPLCTRELHLMLLQSTQGTMLRHLARPGAAEARIAQTMARMRSTPRHRCMCPIWPATAA